MSKKLVEMLREHQFDVARWFDPQSMHLIAEKVKPHVDELYMTEAESGNYVSVRLFTGEPKTYDDRPHASGGGQREIFLAEGKGKITEHFIRLKDLDKRIMDYEIIREREFEPGARITVYKIK